MTRRRGRPWPQGVFKNFGQKNFGLKNFVPYFEIPHCPNTSAVNKGAGRGRGPQKSSTEISSQKAAVSSADFPMTPMERTDHDFGPFGRRILSSPGPFVLLLNTDPNPTLSRKRGQDWTRIPPKIPIYIDRVHAKGVDLYFRVSSGAFQYFLCVSFFFIRDAEMTIKIIFERPSQKGGRQGARKKGRQGTHLEILLSA